MDQWDITVDKKTKPHAKRISHFAGYLIAGAALVWVFHDFHADALVQNITRINWGWIIAAVVLDILSYLCQGLRWRLLLLPRGKISSLRTTQAIYIGLFTNEIVPMRLGEVVRAYLISRWLSADFFSIIPSIMVERLFDGIWLALGTALIAMFVPLPRDLLDAGDILGVFMLIAVFLFLFIIFRKKNTNPEKSRILSRWKPIRFLSSLMEKVTGGLREIGISWSFYAAFAVSLLMLLFQILAFWFVMLGYGLSLSFWIGAVVLLIEHLGTTIPNAPSNIGAYQFFCVVGLTLFGVQKTIAAGFSLVVFIILTIPLWIIGFLALSMSGMTLSSIRNDINKLRTSENPT